MRLTVEVERQPEGGWAAFMPTFPDARVSGSTCEEAVQAARSVAEGRLSRSGALGVAVALELQVVSRLGAQMRRLSDLYLASGGTTLSMEEIAEELRQRRGGAE